MSDEAGRAAAQESAGLTEISTDDLQQLADALADGRASVATLGFSGFAHLKDALAPFQPLPREALLAVVRAVLAERRATGASSVELVWSGADAGPSYARYTNVVVPELIDRATQHITLAGYSFDQRSGIFEGLHRALAERGVRVRMFIDVHQMHQRMKQQLMSDRRFSRLDPLRLAEEAGTAAYAREVIGLFLEICWPFDGVRPEIFYDPRSADSTAHASLHAKCLVVDHEQALITSANFTDRGQTRNIEVGVLVRDRGYARALERQWENLVQSEHVVPWG